MLQCHSATVTDGHCGSDDGLRVRLGLATVTLPVCFHSIRLLHILSHIRLHNLRVLAHSPPFLSPSPLHTPTMFHAGRFVPASAVAVMGVGVSAGFLTSFMYPSPHEQAVHCSPSPAPPQKLRVGVLGATGTVGQRFLERLDGVRKAALPISVQHVCTCCTTLRKYSWDCFHGISYARS